MNENRWSLIKIRKDYNKFKLQYNKKFVEELLIQKAVKTTIQILYDKGLFDNFQNSEEVLKNLCLLHEEEVI